MRAAVPLVTIGPSQVEYARTEGPPSEPAKVPRRRAEMERLQEAETREPPNGDES